MSTLSVRGLRCMASLRSGAASFARGHSSALSCAARRTPAAVRDFRASLVVEMGRRSAKIANSKGKADMARAKLYGRVGKQIVAAVKAGGPSENSNATLASVLQMARLNNIPKDLIDRNIKKASDKSQADYMEVTYEAYGLGGVGIVLDILTDNSNRASASVRAAVTKAGGKMADPGSVLFNFKRCGCVVLLGGDEDAVFTAATEAGADDIQPRGGGEPGWLVLTKVPSYGLVFAALKEAGLPLVLDECGLRLLPLVKVDVPDDELFERNAALCDALLELDDVDAVVSNQNEEEE